jgi:hypothetical protein
MQDNEALKSKLFDRFMGRDIHWPDVETMAKECLDALEAADAEIERQYRRNVELIHERDKYRIAANRRRAIAVEAQAKRKEAGT